MCALADLGQDKIEIFDVLKLFVGAKDILTVGTAKSRHCYGGVNLRP